jgi:hypothetical protein
MSRMPRFIQAATLVAALLLASGPAGSAESGSAGPAAPTILAAKAPPLPRPRAAQDTTAPPPADAPSATAAAPAAGTITDDTVRYIAGLQPSAASPLAAFTRDESWLQHARSLDRTFGELDRTQLARVRTWAKSKLLVRSPAMFYMFSGPDFMYADAFFPAATTYVLAGLEPVGQIPDLLKMQRASIVPSLHSVASSMRTLLSVSFFITHNMRTELSSGRLSGTIPVLYIFIARAGKTVHEVSLVNLDEDGMERPEAPGLKSAAHGVKIVFSGRDGRRQTLYYFSTNLANDGVGNSGLLKFLERLGPADSFIKSASYLLHSGNFSKIRDFLVANSSTILEDDSGIPLAHFDRQKWQLQPFGHYLSPLGIFPGTYQPKLQELFKKAPAPPMDFGVGYRWRPNESNLLLAVRNDAATGTAGASGTR